MTRPLPASPGDRMHASALRLADEMTRRAAEIGVQIQTLANGARLIDAGVNAPRRAWEASGRWPSGCGASGRPPWPRRA